MPVLSPLLQLLYPSRCLGCQAPVESGELLCPACDTRLPRHLPPYCQRCGGAVEGAWDATPTCGICRQTAWVFRRARSAYRFEGVIRDCLHRVKYQGYRRLGERLGDWLAAYAASILSAEDVDVVLPVPLAPARQADRGFNQAELLARPVAAALGRPLDQRSVVRRGHAPPQVGLTRSARQDNVRTAFTVRHPAAVAGHQILLIDDVFTTGATVDSASCALRAAGAASVEVLTLAREIS